MGFTLQPQEEELWNLVLNKHRNLGGSRIRISPLGEQLGMHPQHARQFARTWANRGWVQIAVSAEQIYVIEDKPIFELTNDK